MDKIRIGFVGVGGMGQMAHLRNYVLLPDCEVVALAEVREKTAKLVAERYGVPKVYSDHLAMLESERLDGVVASQPFSRHVSLLPELYPRVRNLFTEKALAVTVSGGEALVGAARTAGCTHMVGYHKRSDPAVAYARQVIDEWRASRRCGALRYVRILMPPGDWMANGFAGLIDAGDGKMRPTTGHEKPDPEFDEAGNKKLSNFVNFYVHQVNLMRHLLGEPYEISYVDPSGVLMAVRSASGVAGTLELGPYRTTVAWEESALIAFERGYLRLQLPPPMVLNQAGRVEVYEDAEGGAPRRSSPELPWRHAMLEQAKRFVEVCRGKAAPTTDAAEALEDLRICREYVRLFKK